MVEFRNSPSLLLGIESVKAIEENGRTRDLIFQLCTKLSAVRESHSKVYR